MKIDERVSSYFDNRIKQVFVYLTSRCQLRCRQCLYKPLLTPDHDDISYDVLSGLLETFKKYGAFKLSFLGGEPTLYQDHNVKKQFSDIIAKGKQLGYTFVRADTNGQFGEEFLFDNNIRKLDELTFSLDGSTADIHDAIRGRKGAFNNCVARIRQAVQLKYRVQITTCVHRGVCDSVQKGVQQIENMIRFCDLLGVHALNFHPILKVGAARDNWIDNTEVEPQIWLAVYREMTDRLKNMKHSVEVRLPMRYIERHLFTEEYDYCPLRIGERVLIMPNGQLKICAFNIGTPYCIAQYNRDHIEYETTYNEIEKLKNCDSVCSNQISPDGLQALCMSYKPNQNEAVWHALGRDMPYEISNH